MHSEADPCGTPSIPQVGQDMGTAVAIFPRFYAAR